MSGSERVVLALNTLGKSRKSARTADGGEGIAPACEYLVSIRLMAYVKDDLVARGVKNAVDSKSQFNNSEV